MVGRKKKVRPGEDRISHLPSELICRILTHLSTKNAVRTSILSTRWRSLWRYVPGLDLNAHEYWLISEFERFVGRALDFNKGIQKLCLSIHDPSGNSCVTSWIDVLAKRKIQHLDISNIGFPEVPPSLYTCGTLVHLRLLRLIMVSAELVSLPCLKILCLEYNQYPDETILEKLISGSPVLEDLTILRESSDNATVLQVRSKTLKRIHINEFVHVVIDAPFLQCLKTESHFTKNVTFVNSGGCAATKVDIDFGDGHDVLDPNVVSKRRVIRDFLTDISRVRELVINSYCWKWKDIFPSSESGSLIQFCSMSRLSVKICYTDLEMLPNLLKSCPKLESLILKLCPDRHFRHGRKYNAPKMTFQTMVFPCVVSSLKFVELKNPILGYEGEMELVRYFLKNSTNLQKFRVSFSSYHMKRKKGAEAILKELLGLPRCCSTCEVVAI